MFYAGFDGAQQGLFILTPLCLGDVDVPFLQVQGKAALTGGLYNLLQRKVRKSLLHIPFLRFLQLKEFNMANCHI